MRLLAASFLFLLLPGLRADNYPRQPGIDVQHYIFRVDLSDDTDTITGQATIAVKFLQDGLSEWALDLASPANGKGMTVTAVSAGSGAARYTHDGDRLRIALEPPARAGELRKFTVKYHGIPAGGLQAVKNKFGERCFFSVNWPNFAHQWLPTIDHPYDKATSEFIVTAPDKYQVISNGLLQEIIDLGEGRRMTHWKQSVPIPTWLDQIGVAQFASRHFGRAAGVPLQSWTFPRDRDAGIASLEEPTRKAIEFFNDHVGPYPYEKLAGVEVAGMGGGMEVASAIFYGERAITGKPAFSLVAHETAHQWFGDSVTEKDWDDVWLSEGFATYFQMLATEHYDGRDALMAQLKSSRGRIAKAQEELPGVAVVQDRPWKGIPNQIVYQKGGWVLHVLRGQVGTEKFWAGIREYYRRFRDGNASTADFRNVMEEVSGSDLGWFFRQWIYRAGTPVVNGTWHYDGAAKRIELDLTQTQPGEAYRLPIEVAGGKVEMTEKHQKFEIAADKEPATVELDPNSWLLLESHLVRR